MRLDCHSQLEPNPAHEPGGVRKGSLATPKETASVADCGTLARTRVCWPVARRLRGAAAVLTRMGLGRAEKHTPMEIYLQLVHGRASSSSCMGEPPFI
jgi:hypothetical protein